MSFRYDHSKLKSRSLRSPFKTVQTNTIFCVHLLFRKHKMSSEGLVVALKPTPSRWRDEQVVALNLALLDKLACEETCSTSDPALGRP